MNRKHDTNHLLPCLHQGTFRSGNCIHQLPLACRDWHWQSKGKQETRKTEDQKSMEDAWQRQCYAGESLPAKVWFANSWFSFPLSRLSRIAIPHIPVNIIYIYIWEYDNIYIYEYDIIYIYMYVYILYIYIYLIYKWYI